MCGSFARRERILIYPWLRRQRVNRGANPRTQPLDILLCNTLQHWDTLRTHERSHALWWGGRSHPYFLTLICNTVSVLQHTAIHFNTPCSRMSGRYPSVLLDTPDRQQTATHCNISTHCNTPCSHIYTCICIYIYIYIHMHIYAVCPSISS